MWPSVSPGITVRPPRSISFALSPASFFIAPELPDASTRPFSIASASRTEKSLSTVTILPLKRTVSATCAEVPFTEQARAKVASTAAYLGEPKRNARGALNELDIRPPLQLRWLLLVFLREYLCHRIGRRSNRFRRYFSYDEISIRLPSGSRQYTEFSVPRAPCFLVGPSSIATPCASRCPTTSTGVLEVRKQRSSLPAISWSAVNHSTLSASRGRTLIFWLPNASEVRLGLPWPGSNTLISMPSTVWYHCAVRATSATLITI